MSYDRKAYSAEPQTAAAILGKRWEDLIDAAASATEEDSRDLTPVRTTASVVVAELIVEGAAIALHVTAHDGKPQIVAAVRSLATTVLHSITTGEFLNATTSRHVRIATVPFRGVVH